MCVLSMPCVTHLQIRKKFTMGYICMPAASYKFYLRKEKSTEISIILTE